MRTIQQSSAPNFFFCFNLILLFTSLSFPQSVRDEIKKIGGSPQFNKSFTPLNLPVDTTNSYVYFYGDKITTKVSKDSGGTRAIPYMRVWTDSSNIVLYGAFNDSTGWEMKPSWTISGGTANYDGTGATQALVAINGEVVEGQTYQLRFKILNADSARIAFRCGSLTTSYLGFGSYSNYNWYQAGNNEVKLVANSIAKGKLSITASFFGGMTFSIDSVFLPAVIDSSSGYIHNLGRGTSDTTTYYYSQSVSWVQKGKDTIWLAAETDTVTVYPYIPPPHTYLVNQDGGKILIKGGTYAIKFKD